MELRNQPIHMTTLPLQSPSDVSLTYLEGKSEFMSSTQKEERSPLKTNLVENEEESKGVHTEKDPSKYLLVESHLLRNNKATDQTEASMLESNPPLQPPNLPSLVQYDTDEEDENESEHKEINVGAPFTMNLTGMNKVDEATTVLSSSFPTSLNLEMKEITLHEKVKEVEPNPLPPQGSLESNVEKNKDEEDKNENDNEEEDDSVEEPTLEDTIEQFYRYLDTHQVSPFASWTMVASTLPDFDSLDPKELKRLFEHYCEQKAPTWKALHPSSLQDPKSEYIALVQSHRSLFWEEFKQKFKKDPRFYRFGQHDKERETVFRTYRKASSSSSSSSPLTTVPSTPEKKKKTPTFTSSPRSLPPSNHQKALHQRQAQVKKEKSMLVQRVHESQQTYLTTQSLDQLTTYLVEKVKRPDETVDQILRQLRSHASSMCVQWNLSTSQLRQTIQHHLDHLAHHQHEQAYHRLVEVMKREGLERSLNDLLPFLPSFMTPEPSISTRVDWPSLFARASVEVHDVFHQHCVQSIHDHVLLDVWAQQYLEHPDTFPWDSVVDSLLLDPRWKTALVPYDQKVQWLQQEIEKKALEKLDRLQQTLTVSKSEEED
ncbi:hypothetical protein HMI56_003528 [Coelomomyces lativittatus]|nr:hypothetical protein HMI56_003528 [Coelomomyces lativittatus]